MDEKREEEEASGQSSTDLARQRPRGLTLRALVIAVLLTFLCAKWVQVSEVMVAGCLVSESVPPIPAVVCLMFLALLIPVLSKVFGKRALTRSEGMTIFAMLAVGVSVMGDGGLVYLFSGLLSLPYLASPSNDFGDFVKYVPSWFSPRDKGVITEFYEGSYAGVTPWGAWLPYFVVWGGLFLVLFFTMMCLVRIFYDNWVRQDRLTFPIVRMTTSIGYASVSQEGQPPFFRNPMVWLGVGIAFFYNGTNFLKAFNADFPALGIKYDLTGILQERPWSALGAWYFRWDPSLVGMGFLMSTEVLLSVLAGFFLTKAQSIAAAAIGYETFFPLREAASTGSFLVLALLLIWGTRRYLWQSIRRAFGLAATEEHVPLSPRWAIRGLVIGALLIFGFFLACKASLWQVGVDLALWPIAIFMFLFFAFALVYARIRAETGAPLSWLYPFGAHQYVIYNYFGNNTILHLGGGKAGAADIIMFAQLWFLSRGFFQSEMGVQVENFRIGEVTGAGTRPMAWAGIVGLLLGLIFGMYFHFIAYYNYGANNLHMRLDYQIHGLAVGRIAYAGQADPQRRAWIAAHLIGMASTAGVAFARRAFFRFPLHPLGLAMGICLGDPLWGPCFLAWSSKTIALNTGGMKLYRRLVPLFLGLVVGHYFIGGAVWGLLGITRNPAFFRYRVYFG